jgi:hypothetical protein
MMAGAKSVTNRGDDTRVGEAMHQWNYIILVLFLLVCALLYSPHTTGSLESQSKMTPSRFVQIFWPMRKTTYVILFGASLAVIESIRQPLYPRHSTKYIFCLWIMLAGAMLRHWEE